MNNFTPSSNTPLLTQTLNHKTTPTTPLWIMRQAGRTLPEYKKLRATNPNFIKFCYTPSLVTKATLQPLNRFNTNTAILFSDILLIPQALGIKVWFEKNHGPKLNLLTTSAQIQNLTPKIPNIMETLSPVITAIKQIKSELPANKALIGFCGAPWTVASYTIDSTPSRDPINLRRLAYAEPKTFETLITTITETSIIYLKAQAEAGANALMLFDSWAGSVPPNLFQKAVLNPLTTIAKAIHQTYPTLPIIIFPRNVSQPHLLQLAQTKQFAGIGISHTTNLQWAADNIQPLTCIQGNLDPAILLTDPVTIIKETEKMLKIAVPTKGKSQNYICNLGHGIHPTTPVKNIEAFINTVKNWQ